MYRILAQTLHTLRPYHVMDRLLTSTKLGDVMIAAFFVAFFAALIHG